MRDYYGVHQISRLIPSYILSTAMISREFWWWIWRELNEQNTELGRLKANPFDLSPFKSDH